MDNNDMDDFEQEYTRKHHCKCPHWRRHLHRHSNSYKIILVILIILAVYYYMTYYKPGKELDLSFDSLTFPTGPGHITTSSTFW